MEILPSANLLASYVGFRQTLAGWSQPPTGTGSLAATTSSRRTGRGSPNNAVPPAREELPAPETTLRGLHSLRAADSEQVVLGGWHTGSSRKRVRSQFGISPPGYSVVSRNVAHHAQFGLLGMMTVTT